MTAAPALHHPSLTAPTPAPTRRVTFAELYCTQRGLASSTYLAAAFRDTLHLPARLLFPLIHALDSDFFAADYDLISNLGQLTSTADLGLDFEEYRYHPENQSRLRHFFLLSTSGERVHRLVHATFLSGSPAPSA
jgi:hypothetical protein